MSRTFDLQSSRDCLQELRERVSSFNDDPLNQQLAMDCAIAFWSMCDWVFEEHGSCLGYGCLKDFQTAMKRQCPELGYLQDIAIERKHAKITRYSPSIKAAHEHRGSFSQAFSRGFDISGLMLTTVDERELWFEDVIRGTLCFWEGYLRKLSL